MEGENLWAEKQSLFMGIAKLIYGATILLNPLFGLVGDQAVALSHCVGRRLFVRVGVSVADIACGMFSHSAILEALIQVKRTGEGCAIDTSLFSSLASLASFCFRGHCK